MQFGDFSPPPWPSLECQQDALRKGLGRAVQWASTGRLTEVPLLAACLRDQRFDLQVEESRGDWIWRIIGEAGATERLRVPILHALYELSDERSASQLCGLAQRYAQMGDDSFRTRLYEIVEQKPIIDSPRLAEVEIAARDQLVLELRGSLAREREIGSEMRGLLRLLTARFEDREQELNTLRAELAASRRPWWRKLLS